MFRPSSTVFFLAVQDRVSMSDVMQRYGLLSRMRQYGDCLIGPCPLHTECSHEATFHVIVSKNCWNCLTPCKCGGDVIEFVAKRENVSLSEAALLLNKWFSLRVDPTSVSGRPAEHPSTAGHKVKDENELLKTYVGVRSYHQTSVTVNGHQLNPRFDLWNFNPLEAFEWGYCGSGPSQLALALCADCLGDDHKARLLTEAFRRAVVENLDHDDDWVLYDYQIQQIVRSLRQTSE